MGIWMMMMTLGQTLVSKVLMDFTFRSLNSCWICRTKGTAFIEQSLCLQNLLQAIVA